MTEKVLIDLSVKMNAVTHRTILLKKTIALGSGVTQEIELAVRKNFSPRPDENFRIEQIPYVAALRDLVDAGHIKLFGSFELDMERFRNAHPDRGYLGLDVLESVPIARVKGPISRTLIISGTGGSQGITKGEQIAFLKSIRDERFEFIRQALDDGKGGEPHIADAYHFWTAEHCGLDTFLTMDRRFIRTFIRQAAKKINSRTQVMSPKQLCEAFDIGPKDIDQLARDNRPFS